MLRNPCIHPINLELPLAKGNSECPESLRRDTECDDLDWSLALRVGHQQSAAVLPDSPCPPSSLGSPLITLFGCDSAL